MIMGKSGRESSAHRIESELMQDIAVGRIEPGERLDETKLAARFNVSRTPVREALNRLAAQGILAKTDRKGLRVAEYSREEIAQMFEAMHEIEAICARLASQRLTLLARSNIESAQAECVASATAGDLPRYLIANENLHFLIYQATENPHICELASSFRRKTGPFRAKKFTGKPDLLASAEAHAVLIEKIFSADSDVAVQGMREHMNDSFMRVLQANGPE